MKKNRKKHKATPATESHESMAALAGGMADDFNNILTTVMGACSLIDKDDPANSELHQCVELIRVSAEHAATLSESLMGLAIHDRGRCSCEDGKQEDGSTGASVRDKKAGDGIVSSDNQLGGVQS